MIKDEVGNKYDRLTVVSLHPVRSRGSAQWICKCICNNEVVVNGNKLRSGHTRSCGCYQKDQASVSNITHGGCKESLHTVWWGMRMRCEDSKHISYNNYGGRGIVVCDEWKDYSTFRTWANNNGYEKRLTIDRINNNGIYEPTNCRWVTQQVNMRNTRNNVFIDGMYFVDFIEKVSSENDLTKSATMSRYYRLKEKNIDTTEDNIVNYLKL